MTPRRLCGERRPSSFIVPRSSALPLALSPYPFALAISRSPWRESERVTLNVHDGRHLSLTSASLSLDVNSNVTPLRPRWRSLLVRCRPRRRRSLALLITSSHRHRRAAPLSIDADVRHRPRSSRFRRLPCNSTATVSPARLALAVRAPGLGVRSWPSPAWPS